MDLSNDLVMWTAIVSFFMPVIIAFVQQPRWKAHPGVRAAVAAVVSGIAGLGTVYFTDPSKFIHDGSLTTTVVLTVIIASTSAYQHFWKPIGIAKVESATSPGDDTLEANKALADALEAQLHDLLPDEEPVDVVPAAAAAGEGESTESA